MKKSDLYGVIGSAISCILILLLLLLVLMPKTEIPEEEGILVSFGNTAEGGGNTLTPAVQAPEINDPLPTPQNVQPIQPTPQQQSSQELMTQEDNSLAIAQQKEKERKRKEQEEIERKKKEQERIAEAQKKAEQERIAEQKRKQQEAINRANELGNAFGGATDQSGSGTTTGETQQGNPVGKGISDGNSWSLDGRSLVGRLVTPAYNQNVEGKITVTIRVDKNGNVTTANIGSPTTISDAETRNAATAAARRTKFSASKNESSGTITYNFKLK